MRTEVAKNRIVTLSFNVSFFCNEKGPFSVNILQKAKEIFLEKTYNTVVTGQKFDSKVNGSSHCDITWRRGEERRLIVSRIIGTFWGEHLPVTAVANMHLLALFKCFRPI